MKTKNNIPSVVICLIAFAAFLRFDKLDEPVHSDVEIKTGIPVILVIRLRTVM